VNRPTVAGLVVPYVVDDRLSPIRFTDLHQGHVRRCAEQRLCGICGKRIVGAPMAFIGPDDGRRCFADAWMHEACARLALVQCPFLKGRQWREQEARDEPMLSVYQQNMVLYLAPDGRSHRDEFDHWHFEALGVLRKVSA